MKETKTNAMRMLDSAKIAYRTDSYAVDENDLSATHAAQMLGVEPEVVFKTIVTKGERTGFNVFCIPAEADLDLKKCAAAAGDKRVELLPLKELTAVTGYVRGGCSPIGMKKLFPTFIDSSAQKFDEIYVSAGQRGRQIVIAPDSLAKAVNAQFAELS